MLYNNQINVVQQRKYAHKNRKSMHTNKRTIAFKISERSEIKVNDLAEEMAENSGF